MSPACPSVTPSTMPPQKTARPRWLLLAGYSSFCRSGAQGWRVSRVSVAAPARGGGFPELPGLRAALSRLCGRFPELLSPRAGVFGFRWQVSRVSVAVCLHAGPASRKTCQRSPVSVHGDSETRETRQGAGSAPIVGAETPFGRCGLKSARANEASPPGVIHSGLSRLHRMKSGCSRLN